MKAHLTRFLGSTSKEAKRSAFCGCLCMLLSLPVATAAAREPPACTAAAIQTAVFRNDASTRRLAEEARILKPGAAAVVLGDSIAARWPRGKMEAVIGAPVVYFAHGGDKLENTNWLIDQITAGAGASVRKVIVSDGTNNLRDDNYCVVAVKSEALMVNLRHHFPAADIYIIDLYGKGLFSNARKAQVLQANELLRQATHAAGLHFVDVYFPMAEGCAGQERCVLLDPKLFHPSLAGYEVLSETLGAAMNLH